MKITTVCNPSSPYYQKQVKIRKYHPNEEVEVFVLEDETLIFIPLDHLPQEDDTFKPRSRKDFYEFIQNQTTSRKQIITTLKYLTSEKLLVLTANTTESDLVELFSNYERSEVVEKFRTLRDQGELEFNLVNNSHHEQPRQNKQFKNKRPRNSY